MTAEITSVDQSNPLLVDYHFLPTLQSTTPETWAQRECAGAEVEDFFRRPRERKPSYQSREDDLLENYCRQCSSRLACLAIALNKDSKYGLFSVPEEDRASLVKGGVLDGLTVPVPSETIEDLPSPHAQDKIVRALLRCVTDPNNETSAVARLSEKETTLLTFLKSLPDKQFCDEGALKSLAGLLGFTLPITYRALTKLETKGIVTVERQKWARGGRSRIVAIRCPDLETNC